MTCSKRLQSYGYHNCLNTFPLVDVKPHALLRKAPLSFLLQPSELDDRAGTQSFRPRTLRQAQNNDIQIY